MKNKDNYVNLTKIIVIWILATISSLILDYFKIRVENILLIYVVGVLISICLLYTSPSPRDCS